MASGLLFQRTNGTALYWYALKDLGSKTIRMTDALTAARAITLLAVNDTYTVSPLPKIYDQSFPVRQGGVTGARITFQFCADNSTSGGGLSNLELATLIYDRCAFVTAKDLVNAELLNCCAWGALSASLSGVILLSGGGAIGNGSAAATFSRGQSVTLSSGLPFHCQGIAMAISLGAVLSGTLFAVYDSTLDCLNAAYGSTISIQVLKGKGNSAKLLNCLQSSAIVYNHTVIPVTVDAGTSDPAPLKAGNTTGVSAALTNVAGIAAAAYSANILPTP
jgi:hypothetical protein